jgi:arsenite methyltransferase
MNTIEMDQVKREVRKHYGQVARSRTAGCNGSSTGCCGGSVATESLRLGYSVEDTESAPEGANLGLGCGNPLAIATLRPGQTVLDLGSGAGFDCFLAAKAVGPEGLVLGVDMTAEMLSKARSNAAQAGYRNVEFRLGEIEALPVADASVDVIISNCVINLSPDKPRVFREAFRALRPGGRLAIADVVATAPFPASVREQWGLYTGCISGASLVADLEQMLQSAGFDLVNIQPRDRSRGFIRDWVPGGRFEDYVVSATIEAVKPG